MPIFQIPARKVKFESSEPVFPSFAEVHAELAPKEFFGLEPLSGRLNSTPVGHRVGLEADPFTFTIRLKQTHSMPSWTASAEWLGMSVEIKDGIAIARFNAETADDFRSKLSLILMSLAPAVASATREALWITSVYGLLGGAEFKVEGTGASHRSFFAESAEGLNKRVSAYLKRFNKLRGPGDRFFAAHRYLVQARRLHQAANYRGEFAAEELLNLSKAVAVLLDDVKGLRSFAKSAGWPEDLTEVLASLSYVRSGIDVGHPAAELFTPDEYQAMQDFALQAEEAVSLMLDWMAEGVASGKFELVSTTDAKAREHSKKRKETIAHLRARKDVLFKPFEAVPITRLPNAGKPSPTG